MCFFWHFSASVMLESPAGRFALLSQEALERKINPLFSFQQVKCGGAHAADTRAGAGTGAEVLMLLQGLAWCMHRRSSIQLWRWVVSVRNGNRALSKQVLGSLVSPLKVLFRISLSTHGDHHWCQGSSPWGSAKLLVQPHSCSGSWGAWAPPHQGVLSCPQ